MSPRLRRLVDVVGVGLGMTTICNLWIVNPLIALDNDVIFHWSGQPSALFLPVFADFLLLWIFMSLLLLIVRTPGRLRIALWFGIVLSLPWILLKEWAFSSGYAFPHAISYIVLGLSLSVLLILVVCWRPSLQAIFQRIQKLIATILCFVALIGILILCRLVWSAWQARSLNAPPPSRHVQSIDNTAQSSPRIIWIVLDELSYQQVYGRGSKGLRMQNFDRVAAESTVFTDVVPAGIRTEKIMPSLMTGLSIDRVRSSGDGQLSIHDSRKDEWQRFDQHETVFQDALSAGYKPAVAGWYIPYCRILPDVLDSCYWRYDAPSQAGNMLPYESVLKNMLEPYLSAFPLVDGLLSGRGGSLGFRDRVATLHILDYSTLSSEADRLIEDRSRDFILIHMPIPHPPGIYDRKRHVFGIHGSTYIDNLALADEYLGHIRALLEMNNQWDSSVVLIMGDHSWRTKLIWSSAPGWTQEEQIASQGGQFDDRPVYILKLSGQHKRIEISTPFAAVNTRNLLNALLRKRIETPDVLSAWVADHHESHSCKVWQ